MNLSIDSWFLILDSWFLILDSWFLILDSWFLIFWFLVLIKLLILSSLNYLFNRKFNPFRFIWFPILEKFFNKKHDFFQSFFGINFGGGAEIDIILDDADSRKVSNSPTYYSIILNPSLIFIYFSDVLASSNKRGYPYFVFTFKMPPSLFNCKTFLFSVKYLI